MLLIAKGEEMRNIVRVSKHIGLAFLLVLGMIAAAPMSALAQTDPWTTVASAGTVDESDLQIVSLSGATATIKNSAALPATLDIRYNVVAVDGVFGGDGIVLKARFRDNGADAQVILQLKRYSFATGTTSTLLTLNSNDYPSDAGFQLQSKGNCSTQLNFFENAYWVEVQIKKTGTGGSPSLALIQVILNLC